MAQKLKVTYEKNGTTYFAIIPKVVARPVVEQLMLAKQVGRSQIKTIEKVEVR
jgi:hypothetical protein